MSVSAIPEGYGSVNVYLVVSDAAASVEFIKQAFGAEVTEYVTDSAGRPVHVALRIGRTLIMLGQAGEGQRLSHTTLFIYTEDCDSMFAAAVAAGGKVIRYMTDQPYGDRNGGVEDRDGNRWYIGTHKEHVSDDEIERRYAEMEAKCNAEGLSEQQF
ncbi:VOC family protein [bacterium]|nr:VOC family protein [bacterium]